MLPDSLDADVAIVGAGRRLATDDTVISASAVQAM